jgi:hypothetical protein
MPARSNSSSRYGLSAVYPGVKSIVRRSDTIPQVGLDVSVLLWIDNDIGMKTPVCVIYSTQYTLLLWLHDSCIFDPRKTFTRPGPLMPWQFPPFRRYITTFPIFNLGPGFFCKLKKLIFNVSRVIFIDFVELSNQKCLRLNWCTPSVSTLTESTTCCMYWVFT